MGELDGKVALITGAGSGIGRATAERFAAEGARICVVDFDDTGGTETAESVGGIFVHADVGDVGENDAAFERCTSEVGPIDIAYLNAGIAIGFGDITTLDDDEYRRIMRVNVDGVFYGARAAIRAMTGRGGAIVATASIAGLMPFQHDPVYDATKHAVVGLIRSIALTLAPSNITANTVNPGITDTNILNDETKEMLRGASFPMLEATDIADTVFRIVTGGETGQCWVCQPGRAAEPYRFAGIPGPRGEGAGTVPPGLWNND